MYTSSSKHSSLSPNQFFRPQRDVSPSTKHPSHKTKYYSTQQVSRMIKSYIQPKILYLRNELQQKNRIIQQLNQKLDENDDKLNRLYNYAQNMIKKQKQSQQSQQSIQLVNQLVNDKLKQYWQTVNGQIDKIKQTFLDHNKIDVRKVQARIEMQLQQIRKHTTEYIQQSRVKNNSYWLKIKQALNRINSKVTKIDDSLITTVQQIQQYKGIQLKQIQDIQQMHKSKTVVKKLIELKKSVQNIYENYSHLLQLQNLLKNRINQNGRQEQINRKPQSRLIMMNDKNDDSQMGNNNNSEQLLDFGDRQQYTETLGSNVGGNTFPMFRKKHNNPLQEKKQQQQQQQQYQQQQKQYSQFMMSASQQQQSFPEPSYNNNRYNPNSYNFKQGDSQRHLGQENFVLQYSRDQNNNSDLFYQQPQNMTNKNTKNDQATFPMKYFVPPNSNTNKKINNSGFLANQVSPIKSTPSQTSKFQAGMSSPTDLSCLNSSVNALRHNASRSTSFVNLSLQNRNQMSESVKQRLQQIIELKNLTKPLLVYLDQINYLKNNQGNYIFDTRGNMFKVNLEEGKQLQRMGIISFIDKGASNSNQKRKNNQMLDKLSIPQNLRSKSAQMTKVKPLFIKQTQI